MYLIHILILSFSSNLQGPHPEQEHLSSPAPPGDLSAAQRLQGVLRAPPRAVRAQLVQAHEGSALLAGGEALPEEVQVVGCGWRRNRGQDAGGRGRHLQQAAQDVKASERERRRL